MRSIGSSAFSLGDFFARAGKYFSNKDAIIFEDKRFTYGQINNRVNKLSNALLDLGIKKGEKVAILFYNSPQYIESYFAVIKTGALIVPLNFRLARPELIYQINDSDSSSLIYGSEFSEIIELIRPELPKIRHYICYGEKVSTNVINYEELLLNYPSSEPNIDIGLEEECAIYYTAGTTGYPKGSFETHNNLLWDGILTIMCCGYRADDIILCIAPFFHVGVWRTIFLPCLWLGNTLVVEKTFEPERALQIIEKEKVTSVFLVPSMSVTVLSLLDKEKYDLSSLRIYLTGGAPTPIELRKRITEFLPNVELIDCYGTTETSWIAYYPPGAASKGDTAGVPIFKVRVVNERGEDMPPGEMGEVVVNSGPRPFRGYYNDPEKTKEVTKGGWFYTGDMAKLDEEGYLYVVDRKKDMILSGGENVYSAEVERVIYSHPKILEVATIGLPDEKWGEQVTAVVNLKPGEEMSEEELIKFCRKELAGYKCPKKVIFLNEPLPKSGTGKILKRELRERFSASLK